MVVMSANRFRNFLVLILLLVFTLGLNPAEGFDEGLTDDDGSARLLGYILKRQLEANHFSGKKFDDTLSRAAYELYLKQLDSQKLFLLKEDVEKLKVYADLIDDEMNSGKMELPKIGSSLLMKRVVEVQPMVKELLSQEFDFSQEESLEADPEKRDYCSTGAELRERWRKVLKYQVLNRYLSLLEEETEKEGKEKRKAPPENLQRVAQEKVLKSYDTLFSRMIKDEKVELFERYIRAITKAFDPHTEYLPPMTKEDFDINMKGSLEGIGATLREEEGYIKVEGIIPGGPASLQGQLQAEDLILKVGEGAGEPMDIVGMKVRDAVRLIRGKKGTEVRLTVRKRNGVELLIPITRDVVQIEETFAKGTVLKDGKSDKTFGYIQIPTFYRDFENTRDGGKGRNSTDDVRDEIGKFESEKISGLIIDLRNNGGGALADAIGIAGLFIKTGPVVQVKNSRGEISVLSDTDGDVRYTGPMIVLVNRFSASASEILAGALQDYGRAIIIGGDHTYGKGTVQAVMDLNETLLLQYRDQYRRLGALKLTTQKFYRVSGESTQHRGVIPDIELPDPLEGLKSGERFLDFALPWDTINPATYAKWSHQWTDLSEIKSRSGKRVSSREDFANIALESRRLSEQQQRTMQSLNIDTVRKEREEAKRLTEKLGKNVKGFADPEKKKDTPQQPSAEEKRKKWVKETNEDPYVQEAIAVLADMISQTQASPAAGGTAVTR